MIAWPVRRRRRRPIEIVDVVDVVDVPALEPAEPAAIDSAAERLALPSPRSLPRRRAARLGRLHPDDVVDAWRAQLRVMARRGNRTAKGYLRRLAAAGGRLGSASSAAQVREADAEYREAKQIAEAYEDQQRRNSELAWSAAVRAGTELDGLKAIAARARAELGPWTFGEHVGEDS